jgi:hypothetical protein
MWVQAQHMIPAHAIPVGQVVAFVDASDDTTTMARRKRDASGVTCLAGCRFTDLQEGLHRFRRLPGSV